MFEVFPHTKATTARRPGLSRSLRILCAAIAIWAVGSLTAAHWLTSRRRPPFPEPVPATLAGAYESLTLRTQDGYRIGAWYRDGKRDGPSVLLIHGNGGSRWNCLTRAELLAGAGYPVLLVSLRAHGDSSGSYNDFGYGARHDVVAAVEFLERRRPGRPVVILGTSLGGAAALFAARELDHRVAGYILESPYRDLRSAVWNRVEDALPPVLDLVAYGSLLAASTWVVPHLDRISAWEAVRHVPADVPVLIMAGERDRMARPEEARALYDRVRDHGELIVFPAAGHLRMLETDRLRYGGAVLGFLEGVRARRR